MTAGAVLAAVAVAFALLALEPRSRVGAVVARLAPGPAAPLPARALGAAAAAALTALFLGPLAGPLAAYAAWVVPGVAADRRRAAQDRRVERASRDLVEWVEALVAAGRPPESALASVVASGVGEPALDRALGTAAEAYALGAPLHRSLASAAAAVGAARLAALAIDLGRERDLGRAALVPLRAARDDLRDAERARALAAASGAEPALALILVLCYLPALMLAAIVPLFLGLVRAVAA